MYSWILLGVVALIILLCAGIAALFGLPKAKARLITTAVCAAVSLVVCWVIKTVLPSPNVIMNYVEDNMGWIGSQFGASAVRIA